jgi:hypothetical protein
MTCPSGQNPWRLAYYTLFHSSGGQKFFHRPEDLQAEGWILQSDRTYRHPDGRLMVPVFEGQMINRYDHRAKTYEGYTGSKYLFLNLLGDIPEPSPWWLWSALIARVSGANVRKRSEERS